jgi:hypothetical protein
VRAGAGGGSRFRGSRESVAAADQPAGSPSTPPNPSPSPPPTPPHPAPRCTPGGDGDFYHLEQGSVTLLEVVLHGLLAPPGCGAPGASNGAAAREPAGAAAAAPPGGGDALMRSASGMSTGSGGAPARLLPALRPSCRCGARGA